MRELITDLVPWSGLNISGIRSVSSRDCYCLCTHLFSRSFWIQEWIPDRKRSVICGSANILSANIANDRSLQLNVSNSNIEVAMNVLDIAQFRIMHNIYTVQVCEPRLQKDLSQSNSTVAKQGRGMTPTTCFSN